MVFVMQRWWLAVDEFFATQKASGSGCLCVF